MKNHGRASAQKGSIRVRTLARTIVDMSPVSKLLGRAVVSVAFVSLLIGPPLLNGGGLPDTEQFSGTSIYVDPHNPGAFDRNPGTRDEPVLTIFRAVLLARGSLRQGLATRIVLADGIYRESISLDGLSQDVAGPLTIEAANKGQAVITGSDKLTDWARSDSDLYAHRWDQRWGLVPYPPGWQSANLQPITRRREMVFADGRPLQQVLSMPELRAQPTGFFVSESEQRIYVRLPPNGKNDPSDLEVATRATLLAGDRLQHVVLRGLVFEHAANSIDKGAVAFDGCDHLLIEDCDFRWNNWIGLAIASSRDVTAIRNTAHHNGGAGMTMWRMKNVDFESNDTSFNNWRGEMGGFRGFAVAGIKSLRVHNGIFRKHRSTDNHSRGFWLDFDCANVKVEDGFFCRNALDGAFIEGSQGPIAVTRSILCRNQKGLVIANSPDVTLQQNIFFGNAGTQILIGGEAGGRSTTDWETNQHMLLDTLRLNLANNAVVAETGQQLLVTQLTSDQIRSLLGSIASHENTWFGPAGQMLFDVAGKRMDFASWKEISQQDSDSHYADPLFVDPTHDNFDLRPGSPLAGKH